MLKQPAKSHVCKLFTTLCSQIIEFTNLIQSVFIQSAFFKESSVCTDTTVFWDSVKITVCQLSLCKWAECDQTFLKFTGCFSIREVSEMFDLPASTLRYYESEGLFRYNGVLSIFRLWNQHLFDSIVLFFPRYLYTFSLYLIYPSPKASSRKTSSTYTICR